MCEHGDRATHTAPQSLTAGFSHPYSDYREPQVRSVTEGSFTCLGMVPCLAKVTSKVGLLGRGSARLHRSRDGRPPQSSQFETTTEAFPRVLMAILDPLGALARILPPRGSRAAFLLDQNSTPSLHSTSQSVCGTSDAPLSYEGSSFDKPLRSDLSGNLLQGVDPPLYPKLVPGPQTRILLSCLQFQRRASKRP